MVHDEMVRQYHQLNGHESEQTPGVSEGQPSLACYSQQGYKESDTTSQLNNKNQKKHSSFLLQWWLFVALSSSLNLLEFTSATIWAWFFLFWKIIHSIFKIDIVLFR